MVYAWTLPKTPHSFRMYSLKNDTIVSISDGHIITRWKTLHPKEEFSYGISYYVVKHGWKISKFYKENGTLAYIYCDIIDTSYDKNTDTYIFTDLLADVIIENDGFVRVVDLDELADACRMSIISNDMLVTSCTASMHCFLLFITGILKII